MQPTNHLLKWKIALLFGAVLVPALSHAQSPQVSPLPKAPPEIMAEEKPDPRACQQQELNAGKGNKPRSETTGTSLSEQLTRSDGVICPPSGSGLGHQSAYPGGRAHTGDRASGKPWRRSEYTPEVIALAFMADRNSMSAASCRHGFMPTHSRPNCIKTA